MIADVGRLKKVCKHAFPLASARTRVTYESDMLRGPRADFLRGVELEQQITGFAQVILHDMGST